MTGLTILMPRHYSAVRIRTRQYEPTICYGAVAFLAGPEFHWDGVYDIPPCVGGGHCGDVRRVMWQGDHVALRWHPDPQHETRMTRDELLSLGPRRVVGVTNPLDPDFMDFLKARFEEAAP